MRECVIERIEQDGFDVVRINGSLDSFSFSKLEGALSALKEAQRHRVILDCSGLNYISSVALGALIGFSRQAREQGGNLVLAQLSPKVYNIIELLGFHRILSIHETREAAIQAFSS
jgi:anti-sigma B factor antagonist